MRVASQAFDGLQQQNEYWRCTIPTGGERKKNLRKTPSLPVAQLEKSNTMRGT